MSNPHVLLVSLSRDEELIFPMVSLNGVDGMRFMFHYFTISILELHLLS